MVAGSPGQCDEEYVNPSLGQIGVMYYDSTNNRIKFFSSDIHSSAQSIDSLIGQGIGMMQQNAATRLNARFFVRGNYRNKNIEARIHLNNGFSGIDLVFIGVNAQERTDTTAVTSAEDELISNVLAGQPSRRSIPDMYQIQRLSTASLCEEDINSMVELYGEAFTTYTAVLDAGSVSAMVENSVVYAVRERQTGKIVSTAVAEIGVIQTPEREFRICELSEMATRREHRRQGLVTAATRTLIEEIRDSVDLIYAEARACHMPINQSFFNMGFSYAGRLSKQCVLSGDHEVSESGPYENLHVWYILPHDRVRR